MGGDIGTGREGRGRGTAACSGVGRDAWTGYVTLEGSSTIEDVLSDLDHYGVARNLWAYSPKMRDEYSCLTYFITPINRLPLELLHQIFLIIIEEMGGPLLVLMHVTLIGYPRTCQHRDPSPIQSPRALSGKSAVQCHL